MTDVFGATGVVAVVPAVGGVIAVAVFASPVVAGGVVGGVVAVAVGLVLLSVAADVVLGLVVALSVVLLLVLDAVGSAGLSATSVAGFFCRISGRYGLAMPRS